MGRRAGLSVVAALLLGGSLAAVPPALANPLADLGISVSGAPSSASTGYTITYTYTVTNAGPADADDPIVSVTLGGVAALDASSSSQGACVGTAPVQCSLGALPAGDSATVVVTVGLSATGSATADAGVADAGITDPNSANNSVSSSTSVGSGTGTGLWVTQRSSTEPYNVASFRLTPFVEDSLTGFAQAGGSNTGSFGIAITPDGRYLYVTNDNGGNSVSQYSVSPTGTLTALVPATVAVSQSSGSEPEDLTVDPTGRWLYVSNPFASSISQLRIDPSTGALTLVNEFQSGSSPDLQFPTGVALSPDGASLYATDYVGGDIAEFDVDPLSGAITPKSGTFIDLPNEGAEPRRIVTAAIDGTDYAYVSDYANDQIVQFTIDPASGELTEDGTVGTDSGPTGLVVNQTTSPASLYVAAEGSGTVDEYDIDPTAGSLTAKASASISAGTGADGLALAPDGRELYVGDSGDDNLNLYTVAADGTLADDPTNPQVIGGTDPSTPLVHALPGPPVAPPTPVGGALTQLAAPNDCVTGNALGCNTLIAPSLGADYQTIVSPDDDNVYAVAWLGELVEFSRDAAGALTEIGCTSDGGPCPTEVPESSNPRAVAISPDGNNVYIATNNDALVTLSRGAGGLLAFDGCLNTGDSRCTDVTGLDGGPNGLAVSPDGKNVYVTAGGGSDSSIAEFSRDTVTGALTQLGAGNACITNDPTNPDDCGDSSATGLANPVDIAVSPDGNNVYVAAGGLGPGGDVAEFLRSGPNGALTQLLPPDDCLTSAGSGVACGNTSGTGFNGEESIALSPDGRSAYLNSWGDSALIELTRDVATGALEPLPGANDCISSDLANPGGCGSDDAAALNSVQGVAVSPDGLNVYASASGPSPVAATGAYDAVDEFVRNPITGALTQMAAPFDCLTQNGSRCSIYNVNGLDSPRRLTVSPDGRNVYVASQNNGTQNDGGSLVELARTPPSADLSISETGAPASGPVGESISYGYTVADGGPSDVDDPVVTVPLAGEETLLSVVSSQGSCSGATTITCDLGPMLSSTSATVTVNVRLASTGPATVTASVVDATDVTDPHPYNNANITTTIVSEPAPVNTGLPAISGTVQQGRALSSTTGTWTNFPLSYSYQWEQCDLSGLDCSNINGATASSYAPTAADVGHTVRVTVTASNGGGHASATSLPSSPVLVAAPVNQTAPTVSGIAQQGAALAAGVGTWMNSPTVYSYQWWRCDSSGANCVSVSGAGLAYYLLGPADVGDTMRVIVTATNPGGSTAARSMQSQVVAEIGAPANTFAPAVSGTAQQGDALSATEGFWTNSPTSYAYQWLRCDGGGAGCATIAGATADSYVASAADVGDTLRVRVTASNTTGATPADSAATAVVVPAPPANSSLPAISGAVVQGQALSASAGAWQNSPSGYAYRWLQCDASGANCATISGASANAYVPAAGDVGHTLRVTVTASNAGGAAAATSAQTVVVAGIAVVNNAPAGTLAPAVLGSSADLRPVSGTVLIRLPGSRVFTLLASAINIPMGSTINAANGVVSLTVALPGGGTQTGDFYGGEFVLTQTPNGMTIATLAGGSYAGCPAPPQKSAARIAAASKKPNAVIRQLWGNAHGDYTTKGRYGSAAVNGTVWLTQDRCDGTFVRVTKDSVTVVAYAHPKRKHNIRQGRHILIPAPGY